MDILERLKSDNAYNAPFSLWGAAGREIESLRAELAKAQRKAVDRNGRLKKAEAQLERVREIARTGLADGYHVKAALRRIAQGGEKDE